jgi:hypothetical protein
MSRLMTHRGIAEDDARNRGVIAFFKPKEMPTRIGAGPIKPAAPLSQSLEQVDDPRYGLGTHPDIIERMWKLDGSLPERCRWVLWGLPALVNPRSGVIFAVGFGTIGIVLRLPPEILEAADAGLAPVRVSGNPGQTFDIAPAGPEWRFVSHRAPEAQWCAVAYDYAAKSE